MKAEYPENSICILNKDTFEYGQNPAHPERFVKNRVYRVSFDEDQKGCIVHGEWMTIELFEANFVEYIGLLHNRLERMGLIVNGKPISFKEFKERCYIVGRGYINVYVYSHPKENMFAFYPWGTSNKTEGLKRCYQMYVDLLNGDIRDVDSGLLRWANGGLPLGGGYPRREELWDEYFKKDLVD
jgi:hypothetical protein